MYKFTIFLCFFSIAFAQINLEGKCDFSLKQEPNIDKLTGDWYQLKRINEANSVDGNCLSLNFSYNATKLEGRFTMTSVKNRTKVSRNATLTIKDPTNSILHVNYTDQIEYDIVIQKTDETNYIIIYGCSGNDTHKSIYGQVYTRENTVLDTVKNTINAALNENKDFTNVTWYETSHSAEACETDSGVNLQVSSFLLLIVGLVLAKDM